MQESLRNRTISGMIWAGIGKVGALGISFITNMILARLLMPEDFGCIAMLYIFIAISSIFVSGGLGSALIQKKEPTHIDYTTVFYWNIVMSVIFYLILFFTAPAISRMYEMPQLQNVLRIQSLVLLILPFSMVQSNQLQKQMRFKELSTRNICATFAGMVVSVVMAFMGFGLWSLVASSLMSSFTSVILLWSMSSWRPSLEFSFASLKELFSFGGLMLVSSLVESIYTNLQSFIIGKFYSAQDLGYYGQARKLEEIPTNALSSVVNDVSFPAFSSLQDDKSHLKHSLRKTIKTITYLNMPLFALLIVIASPLIHLLYGMRWDTSVPYFQILCLSSMIYTLNTLNTNVIKSLGRSGVYLIVQLSKRLIGIGLIIYGFHYGIFGLLWAIASVGYICFFINAAVNRKLIGYGIWDQMKDVGVYYLTSLAIGAGVYFLGQAMPVNQYLLMVIQIILFCGLYLLVSHFGRFEGYQTYKGIVLERWNARKQKQNH
ncbi:MAG: lipopolysaccharide biosynthesis protein [Bacteroidales bacterium]|nr:lipopolysaccharide biosynthesis protein [Bacteroidales bacterium]